MVERSKNTLYIVFRQIKSVFLDKKRAAWIEFHVYSLKCPICFFYHKFRKVALKILLYNCKTNYFNIPFRYAQAIKYFGTKDL